MATPLSFYPQPAISTGLGLHDHHDSGANPGNLRDHARNLRRAGITWYKLLATQLNKLERAKIYIEEGIMPVVRLHVEKPHPHYTPNPAEVAAYVAIGVRYFEFGNEANLKDEWETWPGAAESGKRCARQWIDGARIVKQAGGIPLVFACTPGGHYDHRLWTRDFLAEVRRLDGSWASFDGAAVAIHPRPHNNPPSTPTTATNTVTWNEWQWYAATYKAALGWQIPLLATEHGYSPGDAQNTNFPQIDDQKWAEYNKELFNRFNPAHSEAVAAYFLAVFYWLEAHSGKWQNDPPFANGGREWIGDAPRQDDRAWGKALWTIQPNWNRAGANVPPPPPPPNPNPAPPPTGDAPQWINFTPFVSERVAFIPATVAAGQRYWRLVSVEYLDEAAANGTHHIYSMNPYDLRYSTNVTWANGAALAPHEKQPPEPAANFAMFGEGYTARLASPSPGNLPSDAVTGLGMYGNRHVSFKLLWQEATKGGAVTLTDRLAAALRAELGDAFEDLRGRLPVHNTARYNVIDSRGFDYIAIHHSATEKTRTWANIAAYHVNNNDWAGIGYHGGVRRGKFALLDSVDTERAHVYGMNHEAFGICVTGNYDTGTVDASDLDILKRAVRVIDAVYTHEKIIKGHGELRVGGFTECPGSDLKRLIPSLRATPPPVPPWTQEDLGKAIYYSEELARALRGDADAKLRLIGALSAEPPRIGSHNAIAQIALPALNEER